MKLLLKQLGFFGIAIIPFLIFIIGAISISTHPQCMEFKAKLFGIKYVLLNTNTIHEPQFSIEFNEKDNKKCFSVYEFSHEQSKIKICDIVINSEVRK